MADEATTAQIEAAVQGQVAEQLVPIHEQLSALVTIVQERQNPPGESPGSGCGQPGSRNCTLYPPRSA